MMVEAVGSTPLVEAGVTPATRAWSRCKNIDDEHYCTSTRTVLKQVKLEGAIQTTVDSILAENGETYCTSTAKIR